MLSGTRGRKRDWRSATCLPNGLVSGFDWLLGGRRCGHIYGLLRYKEWLLRGKFFSIFLWNLCGTSTGWWQHPCLSATKVLWCVPEARL
jgi:hypothetical protein